MAASSDGLNPDRRAVLGDERDAAQDDGFGVRAQGPQLDPGDHGADHLGHLGLREGGADAAADPAAEGQPGVGLGALVEEALGPELVRLG